MTNAPEQPASRLCGLRDDEAEGLFFAIVGLFDHLGAAPAASIVGKDDGGVTLSLHFSANRARLIREALAKRTVEPSEEMIEAALHARDMFLSYAEQHQAQADAAKENPSVTMAEWRRRKLKAEANRQMAAKIDAALSQLKGDSHAG